MPGDINDFFEKLTHDVADIKRQMRVLESFEYTQGGGSGSLTPPVTITHTASPVLTTERTSALTSSERTTTVFKHTTSGNMASGFGVSVEFEIEDDAAVANTIAEIRATRTINDTRGRVQILPYDSGSAAHAGLLLDSGGKLGWRTSTPSLTAEFAGNSSSSEGVVASNAGSGNAEFMAFTSGLSQQALLRADSNNDRIYLLATAGNGLTLATNLTDALIINNSQVIELPQSSSRIHFSGTNGGGGEGILYNDSGGGVRYALIFPGSNIVALVNRAANGVVQIRANTSTAGGGGEQVVAEFQDDRVILSGDLDVTSQAAGRSALNLDMPASPTVPLAVGQINGTDHFYIAGANDGSSNLANILNALAFDNGSGSGRRIVLGRNDDGSTPAAASIVLGDRDGSFYSIWVDNAGLARVWSGGNITNATDTSGAVIGDQSSSAAAKDIDDVLPDWRESINHIVNAVQAGALRSWKYKSGAYNNEHYPIGIVTDFAERFGMDRSEDTPQGRSLNVPVAIGDLFGAIAYLAERVEELEGELSRISR